MDNKKVLVLGAAGMLGHVIFRELSQKDDLDVYGTVRSIEKLNLMQRVLKNSIFKDKIQQGIDADPPEAIQEMIAVVKPDIVINCIGLIKQAPSGKEPLPNITLNAQLPHKIAGYCKETNARLIHVSTDCVFDGKKGNYSEDDFPSAKDYYGMTKYLGEVKYPHCITLRTSIIGHELETRLALIDWFLGEEAQSVNGYTKAIYIGLPTVELANVIYKYVIPNSDLSGLYHVSSDPISKYDLLKLVAKQYKKNIEIIPDNQFFCDRSLNSSLFHEKTGYMPPGWPELVKKMHSHCINSGLYRHRM